MNPRRSYPTQMPPDELFRRDRLRLVAGADQRIEMAIRRDEVLRLRRDGAIGELVVIGIVRDHMEAERGRDAELSAALR